MTIGTSLGGFYEDEHHFQSKAFREEKSDIKSAVDSAVKDTDLNVDADLIRLPLEVSPETNPRDEMTPDYMQKSKQSAEWERENPDVIFNDQGQVVDYSVRGNPFKYETPLNPDEEVQFQDWKKKNAPLDSGADYDLRGAFKGGATPAENGHWPDTWKKPNHPTFSDQSMYAKDRPDLAGSWDGEFYVPPSKKE